MYVREGFVISGSVGALQVRRLPRPRQDDTDGDPRRRPILQVRPTPDGRERTDVSHGQELSPERRGTQTGGRHRGRALVYPSGLVQGLGQAWFILGLERIHQVTNTILIANTGWRIRICIREYSDSLYSLVHYINGMRE